MREKVKKSWYVEAVLDSDIKKRETGLYVPAPHRVTRFYHAQDAAQEYADLLRKTVKHPELVSVRTRMGCEHGRAQMNETQPS
jgi:hypothetical protein